jgi:hypothetical protein
MMKIMLTVEYANGSSADAEASVRDFIAFERRYDKPIASFANDVRIEYMCYLAWHALHRNKQTALEFDEWLETVAELSIKEEQDIVPLENSQPIG